MKKREEVIGLSVFVRDNQIDRAIKALKKKMGKEGLIKDLKRREFYETKGQKRRRKDNEARRRLVKIKRKFSEN